MGDHREHHDDLRRRTEDVGAQHVDQDQDLLEQQARVQLRVHDVDLARERTRERPVQEQLRGVQAQAAHDDEQQHLR